MIDYLEPLYANYEKSFQAFKKLLTTDYEIESYPPTIAEGKTFGIEFPGALIHKPQYKDCSFIESKFESSDGLLSRFHHCFFYDCLFDNCDLRYCDIFSSSFLKKQEKSIVNSCNFSFGNFIDSCFDNTNFEGCSFRQMQFENSSFKSCLMLHCSIEQSNIKNCLFENLDLRKVGVRYCTFEDTTFNNVIFHILDLPKNYGLIQQLQNSTSSVLVAYENNKTMSLEEAIEYLHKLIPYYLEKQYFYETINIFALYGEYEKIINTLPIAFQNVITNCDFAALLDLCSLIVKMKICTENQLREFYTLIKQFIIPNNFPYYLRKSYNTYIENIKHILVDNPYENPEANILIKTNINSIGDCDMGKLLLSIESNIEKNVPNVSTSIQLTHHSPYDILIILYGALPDILTICQIFYYSMGGTKSFSELRGSRKEKVNKNAEQTSDNSQETQENTIKRIEFSFGKSFQFKYEKEFKKRVESLEYTIK